MSGVKNLCEAIILQSIEDLLENRAVDENRDFLSGEGLAICAAIAGLQRHERQELASIALETRPGETVEACLLAVNA